MDLRDVMFYLIVALLLGWTMRSIVLGEPLPHRRGGIDDDEWESTVFGVRMAQWCPLVTLLFLMAAPAVGFVLSLEYQMSRFWWMCLIVAIGLVLPLRIGEILVARRGATAVSGFQSESARNGRYEYHAFRRVLLWGGYLLALVSLVALFL